MLRKYCLFILVGLFLIPSGISAMSVTPQSIEGLTERSTVIFVGVCKEKSSKEKTTSIGVRRIVNDWNFGIKEVLKGDIAPGSSFKWSQMGQGYQVGQEYLLFLRDLGNGLWTTVGAMQGIFSISTNADGSREVSNGANNRFLFPVDVGGKAKGAKSGGEKGPSSLDRIRQRVKEIQEGSSGKGKTQ